MKQCIWVVRSVVAGAITASLLACSGLASNEPTSPPSDTQVSASLQKGQAAELLLPGGDLVLSIPADALETATTITIKPSTDPEARSAFAQYRSYQFSPPGLKFRVPALVRMRNPRELAIDEVFAIAKFESGHLVLDPFTPDTAEGWITAKLEGFSHHGVIGMGQGTHAILSRISVSQNGMGQRFVSFGSATGSTFPGALDRAVVRGRTTVLESDFVQIATGTVPATDLEGTSDAAFVYYRLRTPQPSAAVRLFFPGAAPAPTDQPEVSYQVNENQVILQWSVVANADGYLVERRETSPAPDTWQTLATLTGTDHQYIDSGLAQGTVYQYRVSATKQGITGGASVVTVSIGGAQTNPACTGTFQCAHGDIVVKTPGPDGQACECVCHAGWVGNACDDRVTSVETIAGNGTPGFVDGPLAQARFRHPEGVAVASDGVIYVADTGNRAIRKIDLVAGTVSTVIRAANSATQSTPQCEGNTLPPTFTKFFAHCHKDNVNSDLARLAAPRRLLVAGNSLLISETDNQYSSTDGPNNYLRQLNLSTGALTTWAGVGTRWHGTWNEADNELLGLSVDQKRVDALALFEPRGMLFRQGNLWLADGATVLSFSNTLPPASVPASILSTHYADVYYQQDSRYSATANVWAAKVPTRWAGSTPDDPTARDGTGRYVSSNPGGASFESATSIAETGAGKLLVADLWGSIRELDEQGKVTTWYGPTPGSNSNHGRLADPTDIIWDPLTNSLMVLERAAHRIRRISADASGTRRPYDVVGRPWQGTTDLMGESGFVDGDAKVARFRYPWSLALGPNSSIFVADTGNHAIRVIKR